MTADPRGNMPPSLLAVTIDGPAGSGKSTMARLLAKKLGAVMIDTGAMYRAVTARVIDNGVDPDDETAVARVAREIHLRFAGEDSRQVLVDGEDESARIRQADVNALVSKISAYPQVRSELVGLQRKMAEGGPVVMEGRDTGSVVLPQARFKFFLVAGPDVRAERRRLEIAQAGENRDHKEVLEGITARDLQDSQRAVSPLVKPEGAVEIDTSQLDIDEVLERMLVLIVSDKYEAS
ncbi:MAG: (d)CMP kinase [Nitrospinota bacterium]|nr:(d)CMP kinase [Nitrospinota bacterium]